jgi:hypothetical protein
MTRRLVPVSLAVLLLLSGCSGAFGGGTTTETATTEELTPANATLPPGVTETGVENASALAAAHNETLLDEGFAIDVAESSNPGHGGPTNESRSVVVAPGADRFLVDSRRVEYGSDDRSNVTNRRHEQVWSNESTTLGVTPVENASVAYRTDYPTSPGVLTRAGVYESVLRSGDFVVERVVARDGHTFTTLVADDGDASGDGTALPADRLVVDERGVVHEATLSQRAAAIGEGDASRTVRSYRLVDLGASPDRPAWVGNVTVTTPGEGGNGEAAAVGS